MLTTQVEGIIVNQGYAQGEPMLVGSEIMQSFIQFRKLIGNKYVSLQSPICIGLCNEIQVEGRTAQNTNSFCSLIIRLESHCDCADLISLRSRPQVDLKCLLYLLYLSPNHTKQSLITFYSTCSSISP